MNSLDISDKAIIKTKKVKFPVDKVWWKWTTHEGLLTFFGPDNKVELKLGGAYEIYFLMDNPEGLRGGEGNKIISYLPNKMLSFTWNTPPQYEYVRNHEHRTWVVVNLEPTDDHETQITINHLGWPEGQKWQEVFDYFDKAWETVLEWLAESCKK